MTFEGHDSTCGEWLPRTFAVLLAVVCLALGGCTASATPYAQQRMAATPAPTAASYDRPIASTGCGKPMLVQPGTSADVTITADPAISNGQTT
ncbi:MAG TPA: hypothetical protein VGS80_01960, partial [Ktedonobacterales bacterium]|nr:hypothetical protein [Ktedonobacterales bacterium]